MTVNAFVGAMTTLVLTVGSTIANAGDIIALTGQRTLQIVDQSPLARLANLQKLDVGGKLMSKEAMEVFRAERERRGLLNVKIGGL